jgi:DNA polymerase-4
MAPVRTVLHVDMDMFFVAVELRRRPDLCGLPVVVGGDGPRGVVAAASYEARRYGVRSAMSSAHARRLCPGAVFLPHDFEAYEDASRRVFEVFHDASPLVEGLSLDEAFLDVTGARRLLGTPMEIARRVRAEVLARTHLGCSVGIATNKFVAKLASESAKPRATAAGVEPGPGILEVPPGAERDFVRPLPVGRLWGVGPRTLERLVGLGVATVADLAALPSTALATALGDGLAAHLRALADARDDRPVEPDRDAKSIGHEETFARDVTTRAEARAHAVRFAEAVARRCRDQGVAARTVTLKVKWTDYRCVTRSVTPGEAVATAPAIVRLLEPLLDALDPEDLARGARLIGVSARGLVPGGAAQPSLFGSAAADDAASVEAAWAPASAAVDAVRGRFGEGAIGPASGLRSHDEDAQDLP